MPNQRLRLKTSGTAMKEHFQPEAGNEVLKRFAFKLTLMGIAMPRREIYMYQGFRELILNMDMWLKCCNRRSALL